MHWHKTQWTDQILYWIDSTETLCIWGTWHVIAASFKIGQEEGDYSINDPGTTGYAKLRSLYHYKN